MATTTTATATKTASSSAASGLPEPTKLVTAVCYALDALGTDVGSRDVVNWIRKTFPKFVFKDISVRTSLPTTRAKYLITKAGPAPARPSVVPTDAQSNDGGSVSPVNRATVEVQDGTVVVTVEQLRQLAGQLPNNESLEHNIECIRCVRDLLKVVPELACLDTALQTLRELRATPTK